MSALGLHATHVAALLVLPVLVNGVIQRVKALWSGRRGPPIAQLAFDVVRLLRKHPVYSLTTTFVFRAGPWIALASGLVAALIVPLLGGPGPLAMRFDFLVFLYVWGLGRLALVLAALDTGSAFEGMGASREAFFATLTEPTFVLAAGAAAAFTRESSFAALLAFRPNDPIHAVGWALVFVALFVVMQVEAARMPVDDPTTHLELTMIHEVMVLDHGGPDLAAIQVSAALKLTVGLSLLAALLNPFAREASLQTMGASVVLVLGLAALVGTIESLVARLRLRAVGQYVVFGMVAAGCAVLATTFGGRR